MRAIRTAATLAGILTIAATTHGNAAETFDFGKREYESSCAICHGKQADGRGPYAGILDKRIPELNTLAKRNGGVFPTQRVIETIDGRQPVRAHGSRDMPIWGDRYAQMASASHMEVSYDPEQFVRTRILALTDYLARLQQK